MFSLTLLKTFSRGIQDWLYDLEKYKFLEVSAAMGGVEGERALLQTPEISRRSLESGDCPSQGSVSRSLFPVSYPEETTSVSSLSLSREKKAFMLCPATWPHSKDSL